jgi:hypothetical protein
VLKGGYSALVSVTAAQSAYVQEDFTAVNTVFVSFYLRVSAISTAIASVLDVRDAGGTVVARVRVTTTGGIRLEVGGVQVGTDFAASIGTLYRIGVRYTLGTGANAIGQMFVAVGDAVFGAAHAATTSGTPTTQVTRIRCGVTTSATVADLVFDNLRIDDTTMPGPDPIVASTNLALGSGHIDLMFGLYTRPNGGALVLDLTPFATGLTCTTGEHGFEELSVIVARSFALAYQIYAPQGRVLFVLLTAGGQIIWSGRLANPELTSGDDGTGAKITAYGMSHAIDDNTYTALWSTGLYDVWKPGNADYLAGTANDKYNIDTSDRLYITLQKSAIYTNGTDYGVLYFLKPDQSSRSIVGISFDYTIVLPANWIVYFQTRDSVWTSAVNVTTLTATGAGQVGSMNLTFTGADMFVFAIQNNTGANYTNTAEAGAWYIKITNVRVVTSTTNRINTTLTSARTNGSNVSCVVGSSANMYVGQRVTITGGGKSESTIIISTTSGVFTANIVNAPGGGYPIGSTVQAHVIYADEIAADLVVAANALNPTQLSSSTALIQSPLLDLTERIYEDATPSDILNQLTALGDNQIPPRQWEWQVWEDNRLAFRPQSRNVTATWIVDATELQLQRTLDDLANSVHATYTDATGRTRRTSVSTDALSVQRYGITRKRAVPSDSSSNIEATVRRDAVKLDQKDPLPRAAISFPQLSRAGGAFWPNALCRAGDTIIIQNIPPELSDSVDKIRVFRIGGTTYTADDNQIEVQPDLPIKLLDFLLARRASGF